MQDHQAGSIASLQRMQLLCTENGSSLSMGEQLRQLLQLQVFRPIFGLCAGLLPVRGVHHT